MNLLLIESPYKTAVMRLTHIVNRKIADTVECAPDTESTRDEFLWHIENYRLNGFFEPVDESFDPVI